MPDPGLLDLLERGLAEVGVAADSSQLLDLAILSEQVERWGTRINLSGYRDAETIARRLVLDAAALSAVLPAVPSLADLGSGAGFPGIPMAILAPERRVVLVESRERRHFFQREMIRRLSLARVEAVRGRFDEVEPIPCAAVLAQAVASPEAISRDLERWAAPGGLLIVPGGVTARSTVPSGPAKVRSQTYQVPLGGPLRTIWIAEMLPAQG